MGLALGKQFSGKLLYVQYVDRNTEKVHKITDPFLKDFILDVKFSDPWYTYYAATTRDSNIHILKSALANEIVNVEVYTCPMKGYPIKIPHAYAVFQTQDKDKKPMWWSFDKNGLDIVLQQSLNKEDVTKEIYNDKKQKKVKRPEAVKEEISAKSHISLENLLRILWNTLQLGQSYHVFLSNCWDFAAFVFEQTNSEGKKWKPPISLKRLKQLNITFTPVTERHGQDEASIQKSKNQHGFLRLALLEHMELDEFKRLTSTIQCINEKDDQGYTLLEWVEAFSRDDIKKYLIEEKGVQSNQCCSIFPIKKSTDDKLFLRNVFFIALEYVQSNDFSVKSFDVTGVNQTGDTALHLAMRGGKWEIVKKIFDEKKSNINAINSSGETPLHLAAQLRKCEFKLFENLLQEADSKIINSVDAKGYNPLHWAIHARSLDKIKELLKKGANVNNQGLSPLHLAVQRWSNSPDNKIAEIFELLVVQNKADIQAKDKYGNSVLNTAIQLKSVKFAELLLDEGAETTAEKGSTSLHLAIQWTDCPEDLLRKIVKKKTTDIQARNNGGKTALHCALESQSRIACNMLLEMEKTDIFNTKTKDEEIALHLAAKWSSIDSDQFTKILKNTGDINKTLNKTDKKGRTPLHYALMFKSVEATKQLLDKGATVNAEAQEFDKFTALHLAAFWSDIPVNIFEDILKREKERLNATDKYGRTALHCAILSKSVFLIKKLLDADADASIISDVDNLTPLHLAAMWKLQFKSIPSSDSQRNQSDSNHSPYKKLSDFKLDENTPDIWPIIFKKILDKSSSTINAQSAREGTALHFALHSRSITATDALLRHENLDVNIPDKEGQMAIHLAAQWKYIDDEAFKEILEKTLNPLKQLHFGKTALDYAKESGSPPEIVNLLLAAMGEQQPNK